MGGIASLFSKPDPVKFPKVPKPKPIVMPDPESGQAMIKAQTEIAKRKKKGRAGTIYSGAPYSGTNMGGTA